MKEQRQSEGYLVFVNRSISRVRISFSPRRCAVNDERQLKRRNEPSIAVSCARPDVANA
jgi:hypothetical protein